MKLKKLLSTAVFTIAASSMSIGVFATPNLTSEKIFTTGPLVAKEAHNHCQPIAVIPSAIGGSARLLFPPHCHLPG